MRGKVLRNIRARKNHRNARYLLALLFLSSAQAAAHDAAAQQQYQGDRQGYGKDLLPTPVVVPAVTAK